MGLWLIFLGVGMAGLMAAGIFDGDDDDGDADESRGDQPPEFVDPDAGGIDLGGTPGTTGTDGDDVVASADRTDFIEELVPGASAELDLVTGPIDVDLRDGDDLAMGSDGADRILGGAGSDVVYGGPGDDVVDLGAGDDAYAFAPRDSVGWGVLSAGNDTVSGGDGSDAIIDAWGRDEISGGPGADLISTVDAPEEGEATPDDVYAGSGQDLIFVDNGDRVTTGADADAIAIDLTDLSGDIDPVLIRDFDPAQDVLGLATDGTPSVATTAREDGTGLDVIVDDVVVATLLGVDTLDPAQIEILPAAFTAI